MAYVKITKLPYAKGYSEAGASRTKRSLKGFNASSGSPSEDIDLNNMTLRQRGRMLYMAAPVASGAINTNRTKIVGSGLHMKCAIDRNVLGLSENTVKEWQKNTEAEWRLWAEHKNNCDALNMNNFYELQQLVTKSWLMSGDVFSLIKREDATPLNPYTLRLHIIEADRISTPTTLAISSGLNITEGKGKNGNTIYDGVEINQYGKVVAYHVCNVYSHQYTTKSPKWVRVEAYGEKTGMPNILHIMTAERPDQYRGVSYLAPVIEVLLQQRRYTESELMAALVQSFLTAWITTGTDQTENPLNEVGAGNINGVPSETESGISDSPNEYEMGPGTINHLAPGESVSFGEPKVPTAGFESFTKTISRLVGSALELPYDVLIKEFNSSYSAAKGALEEAWEAFKMRRSWLVNDFCQPVYECWLAEAVAIGRIKAPGFFNNPLIRAAWSGAKWTGPAQTHLDPLKEANANLILAKNGWKTNGQITREYYDGDFEENIETLKREQELISQIYNKKGRKKRDAEKDNDAD